MLLKQLLLSPSWTLSQWPIRPSASWAIDSEPIRARGIIVKYSLLIPAIQSVAAIGCNIYNAKNCEISTAMKMFLLFF